MLLVRDDQVPAVAAEASCEVDRVRTALDPYTRRRLVSPVRDAVGLLDVLLVELAGPLRRRLGALSNRDRAEAASPPGAIPRTTAEGVSRLRMTCPASSWILVRADRALPRNRRKASSTVRPYRSASTPLACSIAIRESSAA
jgi:hypothetical protein